MGINLAFFDDKAIASKVFCYQMHHNSNPGHDFSAKSSVPH